MQRRTCSVARTLVGRTATQALVRLVIGLARSLRLLAGLRRRAAAPLEGQVRRQRPVVDGRLARDATALARGLERRALLGSRRALGRRGGFDGLGRGREVGEQAGQERPGRISAEAARPRTDLLRAIVSARFFSSVGCQDSSTSWRQGGETP